MEEKVKQYLSHYIQTLFSISQDIIENNHFSHVLGQINKYIKARQGQKELI